MESTKVRHLRPFLMLRLLFFQWPEYQNACCIYGLKLLIELLLSCLLQDDNILCGQMFGLVLHLDVSVNLISFRSRGKGKSEWFLSVFLFKYSWLRD